MIKLLCINCGLEFSDSKLKTIENAFTVILHCPFCHKEWRRSKISGIKWSVYPMFKMVIEKYLNLK